MLATLDSAAIIGIDALPVRVEVDLRLGIRGAGKTMLARRPRTILAPVSREEAVHLIVVTERCSHAPNQSAYSNTTRTHYNC